MAGFSRARFSVGNDSASDCVINGTSSNELRGEEHDDDPEPILAPPIEQPSLPLSMPLSVGLSSLRVTGCTTVVAVIGLVTAVIVVPAGIFGCDNCGVCDVGDSVELR